jgi:hypothetical protein
VLKEAHQESLELTRAINADNEEHFATTVAGQPGGKLSIVSPAGSVDWGILSLQSLLSVSKRGAAGGEWACARTTQLLLPC